MKKVLRAGLVMIVGLMLSAGILPAYAENAASSDNSSSTNHVQTLSSSEDSSGAESNKTNAQKHKDEAKAKQCDRRQAVVNRITARIAERGQRQLDLFTTIATRVEAFYTKSGKTLSNYDELVNAVNTAQASAQQTVDTIKSTTVTLKCDGTDPNGAGGGFKAALKSEIQALKDYRTAVKNLIVGVKSVQGTTSSGDTGGTGGEQ